MQSISQKPSVAGPSNIGNSTSTQGEWDHQFDTNSPTYAENDEPINDDVFDDCIDTKFQFSEKS